MSLKDKRKTIAKVIAYKFGYDEITAEGIADDMLHDDFLKNGIKTMGGVISYIEAVHAHVRG